MLQNAYFLAKIGADTAENEQHFAEFLPKTGKLARALLALPAERHRRRAATALVPSLTDGRSLGDLVDFEAYMLNCMSNLFQASAQSQVIEYCAYVVLILMN